MKYCDQRIKFKSNLLDDNPRGKMSRHSRAASGGKANGGLVRARREQLRERGPTRPLAAFDAGARRNFFVDSQEIEYILAGNFEFA
jgi:hypothetical protein